MLLSDLPFIDDVKKGERYLERERYFVMTLCYFVMYLTYFVVLDTFYFYYVLDLFCCVGHLLFLCCGHVSFVLCIYVMYETYFLIYDMT